MMNFSVNNRLETQTRPHRIATVPTPLGADLTDRLRQAVAVYYDGQGGCHDLDHADRVHATAIRIGNLMNADLNILSAAAILHDIGRKDESASKGKHCHAALGAELAEKILRNFNFEEADISAIRHCIATHRYRDANPPQSLEAKILFDADKLDSIGAVGIGRAFLFAGQIGAKLHNQNIDIDSTTPYSIEDTAYREFRLKLCRIRDRMLTPIGRQLADDRHQFMTLFFNRLKTETHGGLPDVQRS